MKETLPIFVKTKDSRTHLRINTASDPAGLINGKKKIKVNLHNE